MAKIPREEEFTKQTVIFVEGRDEVNFFDALLKEVKIEHIEVRAVGGKDQLAHQLPAAVKSASFATVTSVGVVQDADADENAARQRIGYVLKQCGLPVPGADQLFVDSALTGKPIKVGVLIIPGAGRPGYLEDLFLDSCADMPELNCVDAFSACLEASGRMPFTSKSKAHALMVSLGVTENRLGRGYEAKQIGTSHAAYDVVRRFVEKL